MFWKSCDISLIGHSICDEDISLHIKNNSNKKGKEKKMYSTFEYMT